METLLNFNFWFSFFSFIFAIFFAFFIPGDISLSKLSLPKFHRVVLGTIVGMVFWSLQGFIFGYLGNRSLTYLYLFTTLATWIFINRKNIRQLKTVSIPKSFRVDAFVATIIALGMFIQLIHVLGFGLQYAKGIYLCCGNREDLLFHLSLTSELIKHFPPYEPGMIGVTVANYHYFSNLVIAELARVFGLPVTYVEFQFIPIFLSLFLGLTTLLFADSLKISKVFSRWLVFLVYFAGDGIFLLLLLLGRGLEGLKKISSLEDGSSFLINPPRAFSIVIAMTALYFLTLWIRRKDNAIAGIIAVILFAAATGFKVYTGLFALIGFSALLPYYLYIKRYKDASILLLAYPISALIFLSNNSQSGGLFWVPLHFSRNFIVQPALGLIRWELARQIYLDHNNWIRVFQYDFMYAAIFILSILGIKNMAFLQSVKSFFRLNKELAIFLLAGTLTSFFLGFFFFQKSGGANIFNFLVLFWFFLSIPTALALDYWQRRLQKIKIVFIVVVILLTVPRIINNTFLVIPEYLRLGYRFVTNSEIEAFTYIKSLPENSLFVVDPDLYIDRQTPYINAFTQQKMFLSGENILESHSVDINLRKKIYNNIFYNKDPNYVAKLLLTQNIDYIYFAERESLAATESAFFTKLVFAKEKIKILKVDSSKIKRFLEQDSKK